MTEHPSAEAQWHLAMSLNLAYPWLHLCNRWGCWSSVPSHQASMHEQWHSLFYFHPEKIAVTANACNVENPWHCRNGGRWVPFAWLPPGCFHYWSLLCINSSGAGVSSPASYLRTALAVGGFFTHFTHLGVLPGGAHIAASNLSYSDFPHYYWGYLDEMICKEQEIRYKRFSVFCS